jgi:hypothetical protein
MLSAERTPSAHASLATAPATVYRHHLLDADVNLLDLTPLTVSDGAVVLSDDSVVESDRFDWSDLSHYKVGVQRRCPVILKKNLKNFERTSGSVEVHQVFCSALNFTTVNRCALTIRISEALLEAEYRATILVACENARLFPDAPGARTLFLAMLGCGEGFENEPELVCDAILRCRDAIVASGLEIFLICDGEREFAAADRLRPITEELGGGVIETAPAEDEAEIACEECGCWDGVFGLGMTLIAAIAITIWISFLLQRENQPTLG